MRKQIATALCLTALAFVASSSLTIAQQKSARACLEEWQANKAANQSNGVTQKAYLAHCRAGASPAQSTPATVGAGSRNASGDRPIYSSIQELMDSIIDPSADALWGAAGTVVDNEGIHDLLPKTDDEWHDVRRAAVRIIEGSNMLMMPNREGAPAGFKSEAPGVELEGAQVTALIKKKRKEFNSFAKALQLLGSEVLRASDAKNTDALIEIGGRMENVCEGCHQTFWYPPASTRN